MYVQKDKKTCKVIVNMFIYVLCICMYYVYIFKKTENVPSWLLFRMITD